MDGRDVNLERAKAMTRRHFLRGCKVGMGSIALGSLLAADGALGAASGGGRSAVRPLAPRSPHHRPRARAVIYLHMAGAPSQHDLFDHKPKLNELDGTEIPAEFIEGEQFAFIKGHPKLLGTPHKFARRGECGAWVSELMPNIAGRVDDLCFVRSMHTDQFNHAPAQLFVHTGSARLGNPSMGSWATYGLGSENQDLPGFVVMVSGGNTPDAGKSVWGSGFLPSVYQGVQCRTSGDPVLYVSNPAGMSRQVRRRSLDAMRDLNEMQLRAFGDPETVTRIAQYELAYRMQISVPEVMDISHEPEHVRAMYGAEPGGSSFANNALLARRMVERGVRFVQLYDWGWDSHGTGPHDDLVTSLPRKCEETDRAVAALLADLKQRGMLEDTLVVWSGEFGRTPMNEERDGSTFLGRDHHPHCFTLFMAGGGVKAGFTYGETDELGYHIARQPVHVHDLQATILHLLGLNPYAFSYPYQGLDQRLIGPSEEPVIRQELVA